MHNIDLETLMPLVRKLTRHSPLSPEEREAILGLPHQLWSYSPGEYIVREGDVAGRPLVMLEGFAHRSKLSRDGSRQILAFQMRGDLLDLQHGLLSHADHSVQGLTYVEVALISPPALTELRERHPAIARALWRDALVEASIAREWIVNVGQRDAFQRISHLVCEIALLQQGSGVCPGPSYFWPFTQEHIADATGLTSVHVNRTFRAMRESGLISTNKRALTILEWPQLKAAAGFNSAYLHQNTGSQDVRWTA